MLETSPRSVAEARRWVARACQDLGREDLIDSAEIGVSELVANALLHAEPPIGVRIRGTAAHPRIEVLDGSVKPPEPNPNMTDDDELLATFGRGLGMVAMCSTTWGAYVIDEGKIVWFEPADEPSPDPDVMAGQIYRSVSTATGNGSEAPTGDGLSIHFESFPVELYVDWRRHFREVRRELVLLSLSHSTAYPAAITLSDFFVQFEEEVTRIRGLQEIEDAIAAAHPTIEVTLVVGRDTPGMMSQMIDVLDLADTFCHNEQLLALATTPQQKEFEKWYLGEFVRQGAGEGPTPWPEALPLDAYLPRTHQ
ncbi:MAG: ATP-binding protein [Nocardioides sp.]|nr:ATP-binding protein [Nocardioides sp.]